MIEYFFLILSILLINILFKKKNILPNNTGQFHQVYNQEFRVPLSGGLFIIGFFYFNYQYFELDLILFSHFNKDDIAILKFFEGSDALKPVYPDSSNALNESSSQPLGIINPSITIAFW